MVKEIASADEYAAAVKSGKLVVVDYFATWCGPCKMVAPKFALLADKYPDAVFLKLDVDAFPEIAEQAGISAMPTFQLFKEGARVGDDIIGAKIDAIEQQVQQFIA
ncbi:Cytoplasmic thioredoxin isoenzyme 2 [Cladochytrium tenue]|nr:Cytoplasmic thioredoxin isoenzyme 2 [Cladochytrium tenue]